MWFDLLICVILIIISRSLPSLSEFLFYPEGKHNETPPRIPAPTRWFVYNIHQPRVFHLKCCNPISRLLTCKPWVSQAFVFFFSNVARQKSHNHMDCLSIFWLLLVPQMLINLLTSSWPPNPWLTVEASFSTDVVSYFISIKKTQQSMSQLSYRSPKTLSLHLILSPPLECHCISPSL